MKFGELRKLILNKYIQIKLFDKNEFLDNISVTSDDYDEYLVESIFLSHNDIIDYICVNIISEDV